MGHVSFYPILRGQTLSHCECADGNAFARALGTGVRVPLGRSLGVEWRARGRPPFRFTASSTLGRPVVKFGEKRRIHVI